MIGHPVTSVRSGRLPKSTLRFRLVVAHSCDLQFVVDAVSLHKLISVIENIFIKGGLEFPLPRVMGPYII